MKKRCRAKKSIDHPNWRIGEGYLHWFWIYCNKREGHAGRHGNDAWVWGLKKKRVAA